MTRKWADDGRMYEGSVTASSERTDAGIVLRSPRVGYWRSRPAPGSLVTPGAELGELEILGVLHRLVAPADAAGIVLPDGGGARLAREPVQFGTALVTLDPDASPATAGLGAGQDDAAAAGSGLVFRAPLSGRFYARPAPDQPDFVKVGDVVETGHTVALLEVMKTFNRVTYGGEGLPDKARIVAIRPADEADVEEDEPLLDLEPA